MRILIPYRLDSIGGPMSFVRLLSASLKQSGHAVLQRFRWHFDVLLIISSCPLWLVLYAKLTGKSVVQRLDGVYHPGIPGLNGYLYRWKNWRAQMIHNWFADTVIYQSEFSQRSCQKFLGKRTKARALIYNGITLPKVLPAKALAQPIQLIAFANWRRRDQIEPLLQVAKLLPTHYRLNLFGPYTSAVAAFFKEAATVPQVRYHGSLPHAELLHKLIDFDIFLFSDQSACPNSVLEASAAGLPVVGYDRGALPELVTDGQNGRVIPLPPHNPYQTQYPFTTASYQQFAQAIEQIVADYPHYTKQACLVAENRFDLQKIAQQYTDILLTA